jgi:hypothetical protein
MQNTNTIGTVVRQTVTTHVVNVEVTPMYADTISDEDTVILSVNGRKVRTMTKWQAQRLGLIVQDY